MYLFVRNTRLTLGETKGGKGKNQQQNSTHIRLNRKQRKLKLKQRVKSQNIHNTVTKD